MQIDLNGLVNFASTCFNTALVKHTSLVLSLTIMVLYLCSYLGTEDRIGIIGDLKIVSIVAASTTLAAPFVALFVMLIMNHVKDNTKASNPKFTTMVRLSGAISNDDGNGKTVSPDYKQYLQ